MDRQTGFPATCGFECGGGSGIAGFSLMMARAPAIAAFGGTGFNFDLTLTLFSYLVSSDEAEKVKR